LLSVFDPHATTTAELKIIRMMRAIRISVKSRCLYVCGKIALSYQVHSRMKTADCAPFHQHQRILISLTVKSLQSGKDFFNPLQ
jgi:hypothetical protein